MFEKIKNNIKQIAAWITFIVIVGLLVISPNLYWLHSADLWAGRQAVCGGAITDETGLDLQQIIVHLNYWNSQTVSVSGTLSFSQSQNTLYLRDGIFIMPLDTSDCQNLDSFKYAETLVALKGTVARDSGLPLIIVSDLRETIPRWVQITYNAGIWGGIILFFAILSAFIALLHKVLIRIGFAKPKLIPTSEEMRNMKAKSMLKLGIIAPFAWVLNPIFGAGIQVFSLIHNREGLQSQKRKTAIVGTVLCGAGLIVMLLESIGFGRFEKPAANFFASTTGPLAVSIQPTGQESLELKAYTNNELHFSIHQPKGWVADETKLKTDEGMMFEGPEAGTFEGKPFRPKLNVNFPPIGLFGARNNTDAVPTFLKLLQKEKSISFLTPPQDHRLAGGRLQVTSLEFIATEAGKKSHVLGMITAENNLLYIVSLSIPVEKWDDHYAQLIRDSFQTFEVWQATLAACLKGKAAVFYGAADCEACREQKQLFTGNTERLPYVECNTIDGKSQLDLCRKKNITAYPTWEFADGSRLVGEYSLKALAEKTGCPLPK